MATLTLLVNVFALVSGVWVVGLAGAVVEVPAETAIALLQFGWAEVAGPATKPATPEGRMRKMTTRGN